MVGQVADANVGIATGPPGPTVIDPDGTIGKHSWLKFVDGIGWDGPWCSTPHGWHVYFVGDADVRNRAGWLRHVDVRGVGGYVVAPPSLGADAGTDEFGSFGDYCWHRSPAECDLAPMPQRLRDALLAPAATEARYHADDASLPFDRQGVRGRGLRRRSRQGASRAGRDTQPHAGGCGVQPRPTRRRRHARPRRRHHRAVQRRVRGRTGDVEVLRTIASGLRAGPEHPRCR